MTSATATIESSQSGEATATDHGDVAAQIVAGASQLQAWLTAGEQLVALKDGNVLFEPQWTDLAETIRRTADAARPAAAEANVELVVQCDGPLQTQCDLEFIALLMRRMIGEAIGASAGGSTVRFRGERTPEDQIRLAVVWDSDPLTTEQMSAMFEPFSDPAEILRGGTDGLGLAIAHQIALVHGGLMRAKNVAGGIEVQAELPAAPADVEQPFEADDDFEPEGYDDGYGDDGAYAG